MSSNRMIGPFQLTEQLGVGGMGIVYRAVYVKTGQLAAVKVLSPAMSANAQLVARFEREMEILKRLQHPHIVRYYGGGRADSQHFYAMELMDGGSVEEMLKKKGKLTWEQAIDIGLQVCRALEHAHRNGIIHRDLKPANLFVGRGGKIKLGDFGIARDTEATALTAAGKTVGTYAYMAPEQISGKPPVSGKTDLYALGCVLFELLTGRVPFHAETPAEMLFQHLQNEPPRVTQFAIDCPLYLEQVVARLLAKAPGDRYFDALAAQVALEEVGPKVAAQAGAAKLTVEGDPTATAVNAADQGALAAILTKKKKKKRSRQPFYERAWFLAVCLVLVVAGVTWLAWPLGEEQLFARAVPLMASDDPIDWSRARERYLLKLEEKFPDGPHASQVRDYLDFIEAESVRRQAETNRSFNRDPKTDGERFYRRAREFEIAGDRVSAYDTYQSMIDVLKHDEDQPYVKLARRQMKSIEESGGNKEDRVEFVNSTLRDGDAFLSRGNLVEARKKWNSVTTLYAEIREFEPQVAYARARLAGEEPPTLNLAPRENGEKPEIEPASATAAP